MKQTFVDLVEKNMSMVGADNANLHTKFLDSHPVNTCYNTKQRFYHAFLTCIDNSYNGDINDLILLQAKDDTLNTTLVFDKLVVRIYHLSHFQSIRDIIILQHTNKEKYINHSVLLLHNDKGIVFVATEKLIPLMVDLGTLLIHPELDVNILVREKDIIFKAIVGVNAYIAKMTGKCQGDCNIDNIGVRKEYDGTYTYVLFDFGSVASSSCIHQDNMRLWKSLTWQVAW